MITDKQFDDAFTAAGGWFFLSEFETIKNWNDSKTKLIELIYSKGYDSKQTGSVTRVSSSQRIIENHRDLEALVKIQKSATINRKHPEAEKKAKELIEKYFK